MRRIRCLRVRILEPTKEAANRALHLLRYNTDCSASCWVVKVVGELDLPARGVKSPRFANLCAP